MKISDLLAHKRPIFSFEFFPPRNAQAEAQLLETLWDLARLGPDFVSVTCGAGGSTRDRTLELVTRIKNDLGIEAMAHLTCVESPVGAIREEVDRLAAAGIENLLALRGDPPKGQKEFEAHPEGFRHASELVGFLKGREEFCLGGACYPEGHPECPDQELGMWHLQAKVAAGTDFLITQLFFENTDYFAFIEAARRNGIRVPILPGIMPVTNIGQVKRFTELCGARLPTELLNRLEATGGDPLKVPTVGVDWAIKQCRKLLAAGVAGIHFYTLNHSPAARAVFQALRAE